MKNSSIIIVTALVFLVAGGVIIGWSYLKTQDETEMGRVLEFTDENFQQKVIAASSERPILVDFYADWCLPCRMLAPTVEIMAQELKGRATIGKMDVDKNMLFRQLGLKGVPAVLIIKDGEVQKVFYGVTPKETLVKALEGLGA